MVVRGRQGTEHARVRGHRGGTFKAYSNTGTLTVWSFVGRFVSPTAARAVLHLNTTCDGKGGTLNLKLKA